MGRDKQKIGDVNEFKAVIKFLQEGYWVFRNVQGTGITDQGSDGEYRRVKSTT